jgi:hypothetical protein
VVKQKVIVRNRVPTVEEMRVRLGVSKKRAAQIEQIILGKKKRVRQEA